MSAHGGGASADLAQALIDHFARRGEQALDRLAHHCPLQYARLVGRVLPRVALAVTAPAAAEAPRIEVTIARDPPPEPPAPEEPAPVTYGALTATEPSEEVWRGPRW